MYIFKGPVAPVSSSCLIKSLARMAFLALLAAALSTERTWAIGFQDGFETYNAGGLDSTLSGGPNEGANGGANPWFGPAAPNLRVVVAENGVTPHGGTNMIRGCYNCLYDNDVDWFNLSFRCATGGVYAGSVALEWWFYDPLGSLGGGDYVVNVTPRMTGEVCTTVSSTTDGSSMPTGRPFSHSTCMCISGCSQSA